MTDREIKFRENEELAIAPGVEEGGEPTQKVGVQLNTKPKAYIEKVVVEGFKSYGKKRKEIPLGEGFIAIVGPNGSGKSNIGDAISFALGLASSKVLRAKNLSYLIWSKGNQKAPYAEVEVHFKNEGAFPLDEETIVISRKVFPNGRTVFKINGKTVKERDVKDLLTRAGITENAYNVVLQGDIVHFLKMTPLQRRKLVEEIAGIGEFDEKKQKALEELGEVELKLNELKLIIAELETQLKTLERDRENLRRYRELKKEVQNLRGKLLLKELLLLKKREEKLRGELEERRRRLESLNRERENLEGKISELEKLIEENERLLAPYREKIGKFQSQEEFLKREIEELKGQIENLRLRRQKLKDELQALTQRRENLLSRRASLLKEIENLKEELKRPEEVLLRLDGELTALESRLKEAISALERTEGELKKLRQEKQEKEKLLRSLLRELDNLDAKIESTEENLKRLEEEKRELLATFVGNVSYEKEKLQRLIEEKQKEYQNLSEKLNRVDKKITQLLKEREEKLKELVRLEAQADFRSDEVVEFLKRNVPGVYGTVADLVRVKDEEYITAVEVAGGNRLRYVVVENEDVAKECINLLKKNDLGRLTFIPLNRIRAPRVDYFPKVRGVVDLAYRLLEYDPTFERAILYVFGDTVVVEDYEAAKRLGIGVYRMVTLEGELFEKGGTITGGKYRPSNLLRKGYTLSRIEELREEISQLEKKIEKLKREYEKTKNDLWSVEGTINYAERKLRELEKNHEGAVQKLKKLEEKIAKGLEYLEYLKGELSKKEQRAEKLQEEITLLEERIEELENLRGEYMKQVSSSGLEELRNERQEVLKEINQLKELLEQKEKELLKLEGEIEKTEERIKRTEEEITQTVELEKELTQKVAQKEEELKEVKEKYAEVGQTVATLLEELQRLKTEREELKRELTLTVAKIEREKTEKDKILLELAKLEQKEETLKGELKELLQGVENIPEHFEEPREDVNTLKRLLAEKERELQRLGNVNFKAEEEYQSLRERYGEYREKYQTLLREKKAITDFIAEMEKRKTKIFMETFKAINKHFKEIFAYLSPGGKAYMELEKPHDPFAGGINMMVKPRGKEVKFLEAMSGGEKTLAALSLIFALQRYRPAPFYYFDEVDAHLDEANAVRVGELIKEYSKEAQFIVVTLRESVAYLADRLIGVTARGGVSEVYFLDPARLSG